MFINLWSYIRGYVLIEVSGFSVERFINLAANKNIYIWDIVYNGNVVEMKVSVKDFKLLKPCVKKTKCKMKIIKKYGYPFKIYRYRKRKILAGGVFVFIATLYYLSSFVWSVDIVGNVRVEYKTLYDFIKQEGLKEGAHKNDIDINDIQSNILKSYPDIIWVSIDLNGTRATVSIREALEDKVVVDMSVPSDIVANKEGLIESIITSGGRPLVKEKDVVAEGDILVSGKLPLSEIDPTLGELYVHSDATILAKMYYYINFDVPYKYEVKNFTGEIQKDYKVEVFNNDINVLKPKVKFKNFNKVSSHKQLDIGEDYPLPFIYIIDTYQEFVLEEKTRTIDQAKEVAETIVNNRIIRELDFKTDIMEKKIEYVENEDGIAVSAVITAIEPIGKQVPIKEENKVFSNETTELEN